MPLETVWLGTGNSDATFSAAPRRLRPRHMYFDGTAAYGELCELLYCPQTVLVPTFTIPTTGRLSMCVRCFPDRNVSGSNCVD